MIKNIQLYAERHTGSRWLTSLLAESLDINNNLCQLGWKHWFPVYNRIDNINTDEFLFIILSRNPYDWIKSMCEDPHHSHDSLKKLNIDEFVQKEWQCIWRKCEVKWIDDNMDMEEMIHERNPYTNKRFKNIIELRNYKNFEFSSLQYKYPNVYFIKYEDLTENPYNIIKDISEKYNIKIINNIQITKKDKTKKLLTNKSIDYINDNINWSIENHLGYKIEL